MATIHQIHHLLRTTNRSSTQSSDSHKFINLIMSSQQQNKDEEQKFTIQPHPQDNHSNTETPFQPANATQAALSGTPGPVVIDSATASKLETPKSKEELAQLSAKLNKND